MRILKKQNLSLQDLFNLERPKLLKKVLKERAGFDYKELTQQARQITQDYLEELTTLGIDITKMQNSLHQAIKENLGEHRSQEKTKQDQTLKSVGLLSDLLVPYGKRQERVFNLFYYILVLNEQSVNFQVIKSGDSIAQNAAVSVSALVSILPESHNLAIACFCCLSQTK